MRTGLLALLFAVVALGAEKAPLKSEASNKVVRVEATAYLEKEEIDRAVGAPMVESVVVMEVKLIPAAGQKLTINRDDFLLRSDKDGQRSNPYAPTQLAGNSVLVISSRAIGGGGMAAEPGRPSWGGLGGTLGGLGGQPGGIGNTGTATEAVATERQEDKGGSKDNPLLAALKVKILPESEIEQPASGQLYFLLEGKHKPKQIELIYKTPAGPVSLRFK